jgi:signal transduction histidine kinase
MKSGYLKIIAFILLGVVIVGGILTFQFNLIRRAAFTDELLYNRRLTGTAYHCLEQSLQDLPVLIAELNKSYQLDGLENLSDILETWRDGAEHPEVISGIYLLEVTDEEKKFYRLNSPGGNSAMERVKGVPKNPLVAGPFLFGETEAKIDFGLYLEIDVIHHTKVLEYYGQRLLEDALLYLTLPLTREEGGVITDPRREEKNFLVYEPVDLGRWIHKLSNADLEGMYKPEFDNSGLYLVLEYAGGTFLYRPKLSWLINITISSLTVLLFFLSFFLLLRQYRRAKEQRRREQEFTALVSHELKTPVAAIQSIGENIGSGIADTRKKMNTYGAMILRETRRLDSMIENVLTYSGIESGGIRGDHGSCPPEAVIADVRWNIMENSNHTEKVRWEIGPLPETLPMEKKDFQSLLENIIGNALKHGIPKGERKSGTEEEPLPTSKGELPGVTVSISRKYPPPRLSIIAEDHGPGIPNKEQRQIWDPFVRGKHSVKKQTAGNGLGLYLVKKIVHSAGGRIRLESPYRSIKGQLISGCRFTLELPIEGDEKKANRP